MSKSEVHSFQLPPPPDIREVVVKDSGKLPDWLQDDSLVKDTFGIIPTQSPAVIRPEVHSTTVSAVTVKEVISSGNTTLIGDYSASTFEKHDPKWLVQSFGNATWQSTLKMIRDKVIVVDRHYIFLSMGGNQLVLANKANTYQNLLSVVQMILSLNSTAKLFVISILPRPIDNDSVKPLIVKVNRILRDTVMKVQKQQIRISYINMANQFLDDDNDPEVAWYNSDLLTLNKSGCAKFRRLAFAGAGFIPNA